MRIYIIGNDGITLCGETTPELNEGEIAIATSSSPLPPAATRSRAAPTAMRFGHSR
jgi:hypothetical protein